MYFKRLLPRTLFARSLLILMIPVLLIQLITAYVFFDRHWGRMTARLSHAVAGEIAVVVEVFDGDVRSEVMVAMADHLDMSVSYQGGAILPYVTNNSILKFWENIVAETFERELSSQIDKSFITDFDFSNKVARVYVQIEQGVLSFTFPQRRIFSSSGYIFLLWVIGASSLLLIVSVIFMRNQVRPIRKLAVAAERFGKGQGVVRFKPSGAREVRQAAQAFIDMQRRIGRQVKQRTDMLAGVSHDLRTPLTRLRLELDMLSAKHDVEAMKDDVSDMERMIAGYIDFVRGDGDEQYIFVDLSVMLEKLMENAVSHGCFGGINVDESLRIRVRPMAFERAIANVINNAIKYGGHVWIKAELQDDSKLQILIEDNGEGIDSAFYEDVFKPFKRIDESRNTESGGVGLGLSIAVDIIQSHGGDIKLGRSADYGGLCVTVRLPV